MSDPLETAPVEGSSTVVTGSQGRRVVNPQALNITPCDFRNPVLVAESDLRRLRNQHVEFTRHLAAKFSALLRLEFTLAFTGLTTTAFSRFTETLPDPAHLTLFRLEPLPGLGIVSVPPALGLAITNRMLGGRGATVENRALTEIETGLLEDFLRMIVEEWCRQWQGLDDPRPLLVGHETNGRFLQTSPPATNMLVVSLDATLGEAAAVALQIAMPYASLESSIKKTPARRPRAKPATSPMPDKAAIARRAAYAGISLPAVADWLVGDVTLRDILHLRTGDVLELPSEAIAQTRINLSGAPFFVGTAGVSDGKVAVRLDRRHDDNPDPAVSPENLAAFLVK